MMLVLSLFPGIGLLDMAFEEAGFCVVRGPDLLWGGDIRKFHPPAGKFDGVIGGPPCQRFSPLANIVRAVHGEESLAPNLIPEFERVVARSWPAWFLMENVPNAPEPEVDGYVVRSEILNNRHVGGVQNRERRFSFGSPAGTRLRIETVALEAIDYEHAVTTNSGGRRAVVVHDENGRIRGKQGHADDSRLNHRPLEEMAALQGLPEDALQRMVEHGAFRTMAVRRGIGNGVPLPMGRAVAKAVMMAACPPSTTCPNSTPTTSTPSTT